jgi:hypothetical protein
MDPGIPVDTAKEFSLPPALVGKNIKIIKTNKEEVSVPLSAGKDHAAASFQENDRAGIYRVSTPAGGATEAAGPQLYAVNRPFLESRLDEIGAAELQAKLKPIPVEVISFDSLQQGGTRTDLALPLLGLLIITLLMEGWVAQRI